MDSLKRPDRIKISSKLFEKEVIGELIGSFKLQPQTRGNARNTPEKTNRVVPLLAGITIHGQREFSSRASNNSVKFCQPINRIIPMPVLKRQAT